MYFKDVQKSYLFVALAVRCKQVISDSIPLTAVITPMSVIKAH